MPVANAVLNLLKIGNGVRLAQEAEAKIREAIQDLLLANSYENKAEAVILAAQAVRLLSPDVLLMGKMLKKGKEKE